MKRFSFCDSSSGGSCFLYPPEEENMVYSSEIHQAMMMDEEEDGMGVGKKRRLSVDQVHALEKVFEVDNKLEPERKARIAGELGLQPRQVAIWFQNRRARYKTKQLERDYNVLKANYETLQLDFRKVEQQNQGLIAQLKGLQDKLGEENKESRDDSCLIWSHHHHHDHNQDYVAAPAKCGVYIGASTETKDLMELKDGSSDSDSSGVMNNEDYSSFNLQTLMPNQPQLVRIEDQIGGFTAEECCNNIFSLDHPPNLYWYSSDYRNQ